MRFDDSDIWDDDSIMSTVFQGESRIENWVTHS